MKQLLKKPSTILLLLVTLAMFLLPLFTDSRTLLMLFAQIFLYAIFALSYDLLLGYTGIISFGHAMFFGIGAYSAGILLQAGDGSWTHLLLAVLVSLVLSMVVSFIVGMLSLRLSHTFYAMITLAFAELFFILAEKWRSLTRGTDGFTFPVPDLFHDRQSFYYICLVLLIVIFLALSRFVHSPVGRVLQAIRENEQRVESLGYKVIHYKVFATVLAGMVASLSGILYAISLRFVSTAVFGVDKTLDALLMTIIGGTGTLYGAIIGSFVIEFAHNWLSELAKVSWIFERWMILFGLVYILIVLFFPKGILGAFRRKKPAKDVAPSSHEQPASKVSI